MSGSTVG